MRSVNSRNDDGSTPFLLSIGEWNPDVLQLLLDHNADVHVRDNKGMTLTALRSS